MTKTLRNLGTLALCLVVFAASQGRSVVREHQTLTVGSVHEQWSLEWRNSPQEVCGPADPMWMTCPCEGFAFGETGSLALIRRRLSQRSDTLQLAPLFTESPAPGAAVLQRWPVLPTDYKSTPSAADVHRRANSRVMTLADYDHDGRATEFMLQVGASPCGHNDAVVIGISRTDSTLHAFTSVAHPERPLVMEPWLWAALLESNGRVTKVEWACGDHGSEAETVVHLDASPRGIEATRTTYACGDGGKRGALKSSESF